MKKILAAAALVALVASPALARSHNTDDYGTEYVGPLGPNADWSNVYMDNYGGSRLVRVPNAWSHTW